MNDDRQEQSEEAGRKEEGLLVPLERIAPETLRNLVVEFVTRDWSELTDAGSSLEKKVGEVLRQLKAGKVLVVFDLTTETCNIVPRENLPQQLRER